MEINENQWESMGVNGINGISMEYEWNINGTLMKSMAGINGINGMSMASMESKEHEWNQWNIKGISFWDIKLLLGQNRVY